MISAHTNIAQLGSYIDGEAAGDYSGNSVSLSSDGLTVAIGAYGNDGNSSNSGHVRIYSWDGIYWNLQFFEALLGDSCPSKNS